MKKLLSAPYLLWMAVFIIVPLGMVAYFAFTTDTGNRKTLSEYRTYDSYAAHVDELSFKNLCMDDAFG